MSVPGSTAERLWRTLAWRLIHLGPRRDVTVDTFNGRLTFDSKDWPIGKDLYARRSYESQQIRDVLELLRDEGYLRPPGKGTVLDVGANIGMICIALLRHGYFERAIAFEPAPNSYRLLVKNIEQNGLSDRILHFPYAVSSSESEVELELSEDNSGDHRIRHISSDGFFREDRRRTVKVRGMTLGRFLGEHTGLDPEEVALVWLDIQGHEGQFFEGGREFLGRGVPVVSEFWPYGILRSGMSRQDFCRIVGELFTHYYVFDGNAPARLPIAQVEGLFDTHSGPREFCTLAFACER